MIRKELKEYIDNQVKMYNKVFFPNSFPFSDIKFNELEEVFSYFEELQITSLSIARRIKWSINKLPDNLINIKSLIVLNINNTKLDYIPEKIGDLSNLEKLNIGRTQIKKLPSSISNLSQLKILNFSNSKIEEIPDLRGMNKLENLIINDSKINNIPDYLCTLKSFKLIDVRNLELDYFPTCIIDKRIKIKTNDVANLGIVHIDKDSYRVHIKIKDEIKIIIKQYLSYFSQYVKRAKNMMIDFYISDTEDGLAINFKVENEDELEEIKNNLSEYIGFTEKNENEIIPHISSEISTYDKTMLALELKQQIRHYSSMLESAKDNLKVISVSLDIPYDDMEHISAKIIIDGFKQLSSATPISNIYLEQSQIQQQNQQQHQTQELRSYIEPLTSNFSELIDLVEDITLKEEGKHLLSEIYPIATKPTEEVSKNGLLPKLKDYTSKIKKTIDFIDDAKDTYNSFAENYNGIAKILGYTALALI